MLETRHLSRPEKVPAGWQTMTALIAEFGLSRAALQRRMFFLIEAGEWEVKYFRVVAGLVCRPVPHYRRAVRPSEDPG